MTSTGNFFFGTPFPNFSVNNDRVLDNLRVRQPNTFKCPPATKKLINPNVIVEVIPQAPPLPDLIVYGGSNDPAVNATLRSGCAQAGALVYCTTPILNKDAPNPATDGCYDGRNHLYFSDGDQWIPLSNCLPEAPVDCRCLGEKILKRVGRCQVPFAGLPDEDTKFWVPVDDPVDTTDSQSFIQFIVPPGNSPSYVNIKFTGYLAQRQVEDTPPADKVFLGFVVQTKEADPITGDPVWPVPPSGADATPDQGNRSTVYQRSYTNELVQWFALQDFGNPPAAELSGQVVNCEWTADMSANANEEVRVWIVTKSDDESTLGIRNFIWLWGKAPLGSLGGTTNLNGYEIIDTNPSSQLPEGFNNGPAAAAINNYPPITLSASQPPSNVEVIE